MSLPATSSHIVYAHILIEMTGDIVPEGQHVNDLVLFNNHAHIHSSAIVEDPAGQISHRRTSHGRRTVMRTSADNVTGYARDPKAAVGRHATSEEVSRLLQPGCCRGCRDAHR